MDLNSVSIVTARVLLLFFMLSYARCFGNPPVSAIEVAVGRNDEVEANVILSVRMQREENAWGSWKPELQNNNFRIDRRSFEDEIVCVTSGVDLVGLRFLRFGTRNGSFTMMMSDVYFRGNPRYQSFHSKGFPLIDIEIDSAASKVKPYWNQTSENIKYDPVVMDNGEGNLKQYLIVAERHDYSTPRNACFWTDELAFRKHGKITALKVRPRFSEEEQAADGVYTIATKYGQGNFWVDRGYYLYIYHGQYRHKKWRVIVRNIKNITAFVYDDDGHSIGFIANQKKYGFRLERVGLERMSFAGKECMVAFFEGYTSIIQESLKPWILTGKGQLRHFLPVWMCEIPNKHCEQNAIGDIVCKCARGIAEHGKLCENENAPLPLIGRR